VERLRLRVARIARRGYFRAEDAMLRVGKVIGVQAQSHETLLAFADLPNESDVAERTRALPPIYRRLFAPSPLQNDEMLVGRKAALEALDAAVARWSAGRPSSVAVVGPEGSGKTSLLNCLEGELEETFPVLRCELTRRVRTVDELVRTVASWFGLEDPGEGVEALTERVLEMDRCVVVLEGGHYTMLRALGGRRVVEALMLFVLSTRARVLWIVTFRLYPWRRMNELMNISQFFSHTVETPFHTAEKLEEAILLRHRSSGLPLRFSEKNASDRKIRKLLLSYPADSEDAEGERE